MSSRAPGKPETARKSGSPTKGAAQHCPRVPEEAGAERDGLMVLDWPFWRSGSITTFFPRFRLIPIPPGVIRPGRLFLFPAEIIRYLRPRLRTIHAQH
jgi:hypothetical protein